MSVTLTARWLLSPWLALDEKGLCDAGAALCGSVRQKLGLEKVIANIIATQHPLHALRWNGGQRSPRRPDYDRSPQNGVKDGRSSALKVLFLH